MRVDELAVDTNLLLHPIGRMLIHGIACELDLQVAILPEVKAELLRGIGGVMINEWRERFEGQPGRRDRNKELRIISAVTAAARDWVLSEMSNPETSYHAVTLNQEQMTEAAWIAHQIPDHAFDRDLWGRKTQGDPLIIGEAIVRRVELLSTNNFLSIDHDVVNAWVPTIGRNRKILYNPNESLAEFSGDNNFTCYRWFMEYGMRRIDAGDSANRSGFEDVLRRIRAAGFDAKAAQVRRIYIADESFNEKIQQVRASPGRFRPKILESESRLRVAVLKAAEDAGWIQDDELG